MRFTEEDLKRKGLVKQSDGSYKKSATKVIQPVFNLNAADVIYIPYNVPSSKNSKRISWIFKSMSGSVRAFMNTKNGKKSVTPTIRESQSCVDYRKSTENYWKAYANVFKKMLKGKEPPYIIEFTMIRATKQKWDFHNIIQLPCDLMQEFGWIEDDDIKNILPIPPLPPKKPFRVDKINTGIEIRVL